MNGETVPTTPAQPGLRVPRSLPTPVSTLSDKELLESYLEVKDANRQMVVNPTNVAQSKLAKYTPSPENGFPIIHLASPGQLIEDLNPNLLREWMNITSPKLVARVFDYDGGDPARMNPLITMRIKSTIDEVSTAFNAANADCIVSPPAPAAGYPIDSCPNVFLIHNITEDIRETVLGHRVWSSAHLTFEVRPLVERTLPTLLFNLVGYTTDRNDVIQQIVKDTWSEVEIKHQMVCILRDHDLFFKDEENLPLIKPWLDAFIESVRVETLNYKAAGGIATPRFNVLAEPPTASAHAWTTIRSFTASLPYPSSLYGVGSASRLFRCSLCHSVSHPRGLCEFPNTPHWNGPAAEFKLNKGKGNNNKSRKA